MKISVIIPVYNAERYLRRCLNSVFVAAERLDAAHEVEVICVDDGSSDGSLAVLRGYDRRLTILAQSNGGQGAARNAALGVATGDAVVFVDSDDFILPYALARLVRTAEESGASVVASMSFAHDVAPVGEPKAKWRLRPADWMSGKKVQYSVCGKLFRRDVLRDLKFPPCVYEDFAFATEVFGTIDRFASIGEQLYVYCSNAGTKTTIRSALSVDKVRASFVVLRHVLAFFRTRGYSRFVRRQLSNGLSSTVGQVSKACSRELASVLLEEMSSLSADWPDAGIRLSPKAWLRLRRLRRAAKGGAL